MKYQERNGTKKKKALLFKKKKKVTPENQIIEELKKKYELIDTTKIKKFQDFPLSKKTLDALNDNKYIEPTDIQKESIGLALCGHDILGAAKTGSGKTLAFLIPVLELLYCNQWTRQDGLGALIITPIRELAYQIFEMLKKIGIYHDMSAGLVIGGQNLHFEKKRLDQCNIIICTPGRLLHHMDTNPLFDCISMKILVLDEADRCLDMGFQNEINAIIANLPTERQTLLFSATQTKSVKDLVRLSLKDPMYVSVHEHAKHSTPESLQQSYIVCELEDKMAMIWSFIKHHLKQKIIVFFSSCKQVKYIYEAFCRMRPGIILLAIYGSLHQVKRMSIYDSFCKKQSAVLFATDIAARGLDFPAVHWVVQMDCPEDTNAYIHRAGRTARFERGGESLLILLPSELQMIDRLIKKKIPIQEIKIHPNKFQSPCRKLEALLARDVVLKESAQRAFVAYIKSVFLMKDKQIFDVQSLNTDAFARSLGLAIPPRIRFLQKIQKNNKNFEEIGNKNEFPNKMLETKMTDDEESVDNSNKEELNPNKKKNKKVETIKKDNFISNELLFPKDENDDNDSFLTIKHKNVKIDDNNADEFLNNFEATSNSKNKKKFTKALVAKKILRKKIIPNKKMTFDEKGQELIDHSKTQISELAKQYEHEASSGINIEIAKSILREEDKIDKERFKQKVKEKHREEKRKLKQKKQEDSVDEDNEKEEREGSDEDSDSLDLSFLPDPDKIYNSNYNTNDDGNDDDDDDDDVRDKRSLKRNLKCHIGNKKKKKRKVEENKDLIATEELALQLLRK